MEIPRWLLAAAVCFAPFDAWPATYVCKVTDTVRWDGPSFSKDPWEQVLKDTEMRFDDATGILSKGSNTWEFRIVQRHSEVNDLVAIRTIRGPARYVVEAFRVRGWDKARKGSHFLYFQQDSMLTGTCTLQP